MCAYGEAGALAFHTPGHKQGLGAHALLRELVTEAGLREEVSLMEELDDLHEPTGCIEEAQDLAAALYGADAAFFAVNGTTGAIHAMLVAALSPGDAVLVPRNVHRSVFGGLVLSDAHPIYIEPVVDEALGIAHGLSTEAVREACRLHPEAKALLLVSPTYYGVASDVRAIAEIVHEAGMALLVDEAHGAHLAFSEDLPESAIAAGADLVAQSTHKLLGAMTQASLLLLREGRIEKERVQRAMSLLTSTSPNYLLLASLDIARLQMAEAGAAHLARAVGLARKLRREVNATPGLFSFGEERMGGAGAFALDPLKLTVTVTGLGLTGAEAAHILRHEYKIEAELFDAQNVLFLLTYADTEESAGRLLAALRSLAQRQMVHGATAGSRVRCARWQKSAGRRAPSRRAACGNPTARGVLSPLCPLPPARGGGAHRGGDHRLLSAGHPCDLHGRGLYGGGLPLHRGDGGSGTQGHGRGGRVASDAARARGRCGAGGMSVPRARHARYRERGFL